MYINDLLLEVGDKVIFKYDDKKTQFPIIRIDETTGSIFYKTQHGSGQTILSSILEVVK